MSGAVNAEKRLDACDSASGDDQHLRALLVSAAAALYAKSRGSRSGAAPVCQVSNIPDEPRRLAAIALDVMASRRAKTMAVLGSGDFAKDQLKMALETRPLDEVRFYSRQPVAATELRRQFRHMTSARLTIVNSPEEAVQLADIVVLATDSNAPIIDPDWVFPYAYVATTGSNLVTRHELPLGLVYRAKTIASDDPQLIENTAAHFLSGEPALRRMLHLGMLVDRFNPDRQRGMTLYISGRNGRAEFQAVPAQPNYVLTG